jgi:hypothetical protein
MNNVIADSEKAEKFYFLGPRVMCLTELLQIAQRINQSWIPCMEIENIIYLLIRTFSKGKDEPLTIIPK